MADGRWQAAAPGSAMPHLHTHTCPPPTALRTPRPPRTAYRGYATTTANCYLSNRSVARAPHPHQSLPDPLTPPLLSLPPNPSPYHPFREGVLGRDASDITFLTCSPTLIRIGGLLDSWTNNIPIGRCQRVGCVHYFSLSEWAS
eukprot:scaffold14092_cov122-Isochrysis_galbana.AAC.7